MAQSSLEPQAILLPAGTTAQRPASPTAGMVRFNTTTSKMEWYDAVAGAWQEM